MRGKITVAVLLIGSAVFYWYAFWFFNDLSPADVRFNLNRKAVPAEITDPELFPMKNKDHTRQDIPVDTPDGRTATYTVADGTPLRFAITKFDSPETARKTLDNYDKDCTATPHKEARIPYVYLECKTSNEHGFVWINGSYRFEAETPIEELLLRFVNNYPY